MPQLYAVLSYADPERAIELLQALGFTEELLVRDESDPAVVHHAQFRFGGQAGVMWATPQPDRVWRRPGTGNIYLNLDNDADVDTLFDRLLALGGHAIEEPHEAFYGGRSAGGQDFEGNLWSFGSYPG